MSSYVFDNAREPSSERLSYLERGLRSGNRPRLEKLGIAQGWTCLEIGAGSGSIAAWLSDRVGDNGAVVVTGPNPAFSAALPREGGMSNCFVTISFATHCHAALSTWYTPGTSSCIRPTLSPSFPS